ncbi:MAG TPA: hypothetical protein VM870_04165 [Pyrinomonadaceae bacterium]|jgi:hypothetical protein|nr:hypothetical protein [Pyrinomonadaceae bacterium]
MYESLLPTTIAREDQPPDLATEIMRLEEELHSRRGELSAMQAEFRNFKMRYARIVGARLAELAEVERAVSAALDGSAADFDAGETEESSRAAGEGSPAGKQGPTALRKLFWSVAKLFHPDHALSEREARRRHTIMIEASRAYDEGDAEGLNLLLGDERLRSHCATSGGDDEAGGSHASDRTGHRRLLDVQEELRTIEFGIKRIRDDALYQLKLKSDAEAAQGRDVLQESAKDIERQIVKARRRLEHFPPFGD